MNFIFNISKKYYSLLVSEASQFFKFSLFLDWTIHKYCMGAHQGRSKLLLLPGQLHERYSNGYGISKVTENRRDHGRCSYAVASRVFLHFSARVGFYASAHAQAQAQAQATFLSSHIPLQAFI